MGTMISSKESTRLIYDMKERGYAMQWQAQQCGVSPSTVANWISRGHISPARAYQVAALHAQTLNTVRVPERQFQQKIRVSIETEELIVEMTRAGAGSAEIAARAGYCRQVVRRVQRQRNVHYARTRGRVPSARTLRDDYDWVVPLRIYSGHGRGLDPTYPEIRELLAMAGRDELNDIQLADRIGRNPRTIIRWRKELRTLAAQAA